MMSDQDVRDQMNHHISRVLYFLDVAIREIQRRGEIHDLSKFDPVEFDSFARAIPRLTEVSYLSDEYREILKEIKDAVTHHNSHNRHHPEFFPDGINGMNLIDLLEMFCDWMAAIERNPGGNIQVSIDKNTERFNMGPVVKSILENTARWMYTLRGSVS